MQHSVEDEGQQGPVRITYICIDSSSQNVVVVFDVSALYILVVALHFGEGSGI